MNEQENLNVMQDYAEHLQLQLMDVLSRLHRRHGLTVVGLELKSVAGAQQYAMNFIALKDGRLYSKTRSFSTEKYRENECG